MYGVLIHGSGLTLAPLATLVSIVTPRPDHVRSTSVRYRLVYRIPGYRTSPFAVGAHLLLRLHAKVAGSPRLSMTTRYVSQADTRARANTKSSILMSIVMTSYLNTHNSLSKFLRGSGYDLRGYDLEINYAYTYGMCVLSDFYSHTGRLTPAATRAERDWRFDW